MTTQTECAVVFDRQFIEEICSLAGIPKEQFEIVRSNLEKASSAYFETAKALSIEVDARENIKKIRLFFDRLRAAFDTWDSLDADAQRILSADSGLPADEVYAKLEPVIKLLYDFEYRHRLDGGRPPAFLAEEAATKIIRDCWFNELHRKHFSPKPKNLAVGFIRSFFEKIGRSLSPSSCARIIANVAKAAKR